MTMLRRSAVLVLVAGIACATGTASRSAELPAPATFNDSLFASLRDQVTNGSIIGDAQLGRNPPTAVGACLNPVAAARLELDHTLDLAPDTPPVIVGSFVLPALPESMRESEPHTGIVIARWVVDTNGVSEPGSAIIAESPHGLMSVRVCGAILMARFTPARQNGRVIRARVEMPVRVVP
jgi:hypothetical protein